MNDSRSPSHTGLLYGLVAYLWWGLVPFYFDAVSQVPPLELLAHRIVWSAILLLGLITILGRWGDFIRCLQSRAIMSRLLVSTILIAGNWYVYIFSVVTKQTIQGSLGYFILPLVSVAIGMLFFAEKLRKIQLIALILAALGVTILILRLGIFPWIALTLAFSFCFYGVMRKRTPVDPLIGLSIETLLLTPLSLLMIGIWANEERLVFGQQGTGLDLLVILSAAVTTIPLICFGQAVRRLKLITMGFLQYISPSIAFLIAVFYFHEPFTPAHQLSFALIWLALLLFVMDLIRAERNRSAQRSASVSPA